MSEPTFTDLISRDFVPVPSLASPRAPEPEAEPLAPPPEAWLATLAGLALTRPALAGSRPRDLVEALKAEIDRSLTEQINLILHHPQFQQIEASWRGLHYLVRSTETDAMLKIRVFDISKREIGRTLRKFRGTAWDQSPLFKKLYEEEYGQFGGEPFGVLVGDYYFDHHPEDIALIAGMAQIAAATHAPFIAAAAPSVMQMSSWAELANPRDLTRIFQTPEYTSWRSLREDEDSRYVGLCMPRFLGRLPYGMRTDPVDSFAFEEDAEGPTAGTYLWANPAYAMATNIARAFSLYGWCTRIRGIDSGGIVDGLPALSFPTADGDVDMRCVTEIAISERREAELARSGFMPLMHRKNADFAVFVSAQSLQAPREYDDPAASANAVLSARLPYLFACCRFAHFLKCMVRDKVGATRSRQDLVGWLQDWLLNYVDGSPQTSSDSWKASHPLQEAHVTLEEKPDSPGQYEARFFLRPHYQLEGLSVALRLVSRVPSS
jgi:type VI secretion system protein ImpC